MNGPFWPEDSSLSQRVAAGWPQGSPFPMGIQHAGARGTDRVTFAIRELHFLAAVGVESRLPREFKELYIAFRVSGPVADYGVGGVQRFRVYASRHLAMCDIAVPVEVSDSSLMTVKHFVAEKVTEALERLLHRLDPRNECPESDAIRQHLAGVVIEYLALPPPLSWAQRQQLANNEN